MAINKSDLITIDELKGSMIDRGRSSKTKTIKAHEAVGAAIADNDIIVFCKIPVDSDIESIKFASDDLGTTGDLNLGFYPGDRDTIIKVEEGTLASTDAVDEDAIALGIDVNAAAVALTEYRFSAKGIETVNQKAWELAGLSSSPDYNEFYFCATASEATTVAGDVICIIKYFQ